MAVAKVNELIQQNPLVVFSKTYCPYCRRVKQLFKDLGANAKVIELDEEKDGAELQKAIVEITKQRTVPSVFIGGEHIGGCDATFAAHKKGTLVPMLEKAGVLKDEEEEKGAPKAEEASKAETTKDAVKDGAVQELLKDVEEGDTSSAIPVKDIVV